MALFSLQELDIAEDPYILLIKNRIIEKVKGLMSEFEQHISQHLSSVKHNLPKEINLKHGKISKGENYKHLPFVILDYPALFTKEDIFAFRSMFYWGHFISFTIHLQGVYAQKYGTALIDKLDGVGEGPVIYFCINDTPWEYLYKEDNYKPLKTLASSQINEHLQKHSFIKLSCKLPISEIHQSADTMLSFFHSILTTLSR